MITNDDIARLKGWIAPARMKGTLPWVDKDGYSHGRPNWTGDIAEAKKLLMEMVDAGPVQIYLSKDSVTIDLSNPPTTGRKQPSLEIAICEAYAKWKGEK
jgi:hypothetical protein